MAGRLHHSLARAYDQRSEVEAARGAYAAARTHYRALGEAGRDDLAVVTVQLGQPEALTGDPARIAIARGLLAEATRLAQLGLTQWSAGQREDKACPGAGEEPGTLVSRAGPRDL